MLAISNADLSRLPSAPKEGSLVRCPKCGRRHGLRLYGPLGTVRCGGKSYTVTLDGKLLK